MPDERGRTTGGNKACSLVAGAPKNPLISGADLAELFVSHGHVMLAAPCAPTIVIIAAGKL